MLKNFIEFISSSGGSIVGAIVGAIVGGIASYKGNIKVQQKFFEKNIKLEKLEVTKKDIHEYGRVINLRDILVKKHMCQKIDDNEFEKEDNKFQEELRIIGRNMKLNRIYIGNDIYEMFKNIQDDVSKNIWEYYSIYIDKRKSGIINGILGDKHTDGVLMLIDKIDEQIKNNFEF